MTRKVRLTYEATTPYGRAPLTALERFVIEDSVNRVEGSCESFIESKDRAATWYCTRKPHNDGMHMACGMHKDVIATWTEELPQ